MRQHLFKPAILILSVLALALLPVGLAAAIARTGQTTRSTEDGPGYIDTAWSRALGPGDSFMVGVLLRQPKTAPNAQRGALVNVAVYGNRVGVSVLADPCGLTLAGGVHAPGIAQFDDGVVVNRCVQAVVRLSNKYIFFYW